MSDQAKPLDWMHELRRFICAEWVYHYLAYDTHPDDGGLSRQECGDDIGFEEDLLDALASDFRDGRRTRASEAVMYAFPGADEQWGCACGTANHQIRLKCRSCGQGRQV